MKPNIYINIGTTKRTDILFAKWLIALMKNESIKHIRFKIAISLNKLLITSKGFGQEDDKDYEIAKSYNQIALIADVRKATVSDTFNAKSVPSTTTLILIIEAMGHKLNDFAKIYDSITDTDINKFKIFKKN